MKRHTSRAVSTHAAAMARTHPTLSQQASMQGLPSGRPWVAVEVLTKQKEEKHKLYVDDVGGGGGGKNSSLVCPLSSEVRIAKL